MTDLANAWTRLETAAQDARDRRIEALFTAEPARLDLSLGPLTTWLPRLPLRPAQIQVEVRP